ncbi:GntR family transcriptional regulator [Cupriavidus sp. WKF15]|uniref:GntR family transcriptional regulator n=1 Tax=Cupriavidus sp. WKF15 TaxID=3032282 RepID=UPI0023E1F4DE|nr:GntR family transcriptional regulator [Cupriavidus sp. WKF15]WER50231.1 GntR family transcriptional regulator [Cupriavidus sp. WKF15]
MVAIGFAIGLAAVSGARASDIACKSPAGGSSVHCEDPEGAGTRCTLATDGARPRTRQQHHLICDSATLSGRYERIYAEQQRMLRKGTLQDADIAAWRARRDACDSARCLESMFAKFWRDRDAMRNTPGRPASPHPAATATPDPVRREPAPATTPTQHAQEAPTLTEPLVTPVKPVPIEPARPIAAAVSERPADWGADARRSAKSVDSSPGNLRPATLVLESLFSGLAILGMGAGFLWTRRSARTYDGPKSAIPAAMVIAYGLLLVNALLLPFTLGLK